MKKRKTIQTHVTSNTNSNLNSFERAGGIRLAHTSLLSAVLVAFAFLLSFSFSPSRITQHVSRPTPLDLHRAARDPAYRAAMQMAQQKRYHDALKSFRQIAAAQSHADVGTLAQYQIGYCYLALNQKQKARAAFQQFVKSHPDTPLTAPAQAKIRQPTHAPWFVLCAFLFTSIPVAGFAGRGLDVGLTLHHNSSDLNATAPLSAGWTHSYNVTLSVDAMTGDVTVREGTGRRHTFWRNADGSYTHPPGDFETLVKNADNTYTLTRHSQVKLHFDSQNRLSTLVDPNNNTVMLAYNGQGRLTSITEPSGKALTLTYNGNGQIASITNPLNQSVTFTYDLLTDYLYTVTYPNGATLTFTYDVQGRIWSITDERGNVWEYDYDANGRIIEAHHPGTPANALRTYTYFSDGVDVTDQTNKVIGYRENANGELSQVIVDPYGLGLTSSASYDSQHNSTSHTNPRGYTTTTTYDSNGNALSVTDPLSRTVTMTYDSRNNLLTVTDNANHTTTYTYNASGNLASMRDALNHTTSFGYNGMGWRTSRTDALNRTTNYSYDHLGRLTTITYPNSSQTTFSYDAAGRLTSITAASKTTSYGYDANSNLTTQTNPNGTSVTQTFNAADELTSVLNKKSDASTLSQFTYTYNTDGLRSQLSEML
jgi:YD repeat-containing protein